jgi:outer membrane protein assembly factor BamB
LDHDGLPHISYYRGNGLYYARTELRHWYVTQVDSGQNAGRFSSLAVEGSGVIHIAYYDLSTGTLAYASSLTGLWWTKETIDAPGGDYLSLALDTAGHAHIAYRDEGQSILKFASNASGGWVTEQVDAGEDVGRYCSLVLDQDGVPQISYYDATNAALKRAFQSDRGWNSQVVDSGGNIVQCRVAVDAEDHVHVAYADRSDVAVRYANNVTGSWVIETVDATGANYPYTYPMVAVDDAGHAHLAYVRQPEGDVIYATNATGQWEFETVAEGAGVGMSDIGGIALEGDGAAHISYNTAIDNYPQPPTSIMNYATNSSGSWVSETVDTWTQATSADTGLALDQNGQPRLAYYRPDGLIYASRDAGEWSFETVDDIGLDGVSLALDVEGHAHIAYAQNYNLRYASNASGTWVTETLTPPYSAQHPAIVLGGDGRVDLVYYDLSYGDLRYATKAAGVWSDVIIDAAGQVGDSPALALDSHGDVHAVYLGEAALLHAVFPEGYQAR